MVSQKLLTVEPEGRCRSRCARSTRRYIAVAKDQNAGMASVVAFDNLVDVPVEKRRLQYSFDKLIVSPEMKEIGVGDIKDDRMTCAIGMVVEGYEPEARRRPRGNLLARIPAAARGSRTDLLTTN